MQTGANAVAIAAVANQAESNPIFGRASVVKHDWLFVQRRYYYIDTAIARP